MVVSVVVAVVRQTNCKITKKRRFSSYYFPKKNTMLFFNVGKPYILKMFL